RAERWIARRFAAVEQRFADPLVWSATSHAAAALLARPTLADHDLLAVCRTLAEMLHGRRVAVVAWPGYAIVAQTAFADGVGPELAAARRAARRRRRLFLIIYAVGVLLARLAAGS